MYLASWSFSGVRDDLKASKAMSHFSQPYFSECPGQVSRRLYRQASPIIALRKSEQANPGIGPFYEALYN